MSLSAVQLSRGSVLPPVEIIIETIGEHNANTYHLNKPREFKDYVISELKKISQLFTGRIKARIGPKVKGRRSRQQFTVHWQLQDKCVEIEVQHDGPASKRVVYLYPLDMPFSEFCKAFGSRLAAHEPEKVSLKDAVVSFFRTPSALPLENCGTCLNLWGQKRARGMLMLLIVNLKNMVSREQLGGLLDNVHQMATQLPMQPGCADFSIQVLIGAGMLEAVAKQPEFYRATKAGQKLFVEYLPPSLAEKEAVKGEVDSPEHVSWVLETLYKSQATFRLNEELEQKEVQKMREVESAKATLEAAMQQYELRLSELATIQSNRLEVAQIIALEDLPVAEVEFERLFIGLDENLRKNLVKKVGEARRNLAKRS